MKHNNWRGRNGLSSDFRWLPSSRHAGMALACGLLIGAVGLIPKPQVDVRWRIPIVERTGFIPSARRDPGEELVFVFIGSSSCHWSNLPEMVQLVRDGRDAVHAKAEAEGLGFAAMGVAQDNIAERGIEHLRQFGRFDELAVGRGWLNSSLLKYVYGEFPGAAATPQVVVVARSLIEHGGQWSVEAERVLVRLSGLSEIRRWVESGSQIPGLKVSRP